MTKKLAEWWANLVATRRKLQSKARTYRLMRSSSNSPPAAYKVTVYVVLDSRAYTHSPYSTFEIPKGRVTVSDSREQVGSNIFAEQIDEEKSVSTTGF